MEKSRNFCGSRSAARAVLAAVGLTSRRRRFTGSRPSLLNILSKVSHVPSASHLSAIILAMFLPEYTTRFHAKVPLLT